MFISHTAVVLDTSGTGFRFGRIPIQAVRPKMNKKPAAAHGFPSYSVKRGRLAAAINTS
ncbi:hypothetical protein ACIQYG_07575 [Peribacillus sp. NPDC096622]|uniref:hypothetical protein n=1 Tax=Peribacillus sp. NPDC096622 TaxID=3364396 RepID=UPI00381D1BD9